MKKTFLSLLLMLLVNSSFAQQWTLPELSKANTAREVKVLTFEEKECIKYLNLARMYPKKFVAIEIKNAIGNDLYKESEYTHSLIETMNKMQPVEPVVFDEGMYQLAKCFAVESGKLGIYGHDRVRCKEGFNAECCSYDCKTGLSVVLQLLIDQDVPSLGHRKICLNSSLPMVGVSIQPHLKYNYCCVLDFKRNE